MTDAPGGPPKAAPSTAAPSTAAPSTAAPSTGPLAGIRVLDLSSVVMAPLATQILGDLGADVVTVEDPRGSITRTMGDGPHPDLSGVALNLLRNKRNVVVDLTAAAGRERVLSLAARSDVVVTNLRPGSLARLGLAYEDVVAVHPEVVYVQAQGYPTDGPRADAPAYDDVIQAATGLPDAFRRVDGTPRLAPTLVADKVCGITIVYAVLAALLDRERTGRGQRVEVPMVEVMTSFMLVEHAAAATTRPPLGPPGYPRILAPDRRPQRTLDGWISVLPYSERDYRAFFRAAGRPDLADDPRLSTARDRIAHAAELYAEVAALLEERTTGEWLTVCEREGIPATSVPTLDDLVDALPEADHPVVGRYKVLPQPVRFSGHAGPTVRRPAALPGEHTDEVLAELDGRTAPDGSPEPGEQDGAVRGADGP